MINHKNITFIILTLITGITFILNKCGTKNIREEYEKLKREYRIVRKEEGKVMKNEIFMIELELSAGTGYEWNLTNISDNNRVKLLDKKVFSFHETKKDDILVGGPIKYIFIFRAENEGEATIEFKMYRSWEKENIAEVKEYRIEIK